MGIFTQPLVSVIIPVYNAENSLRVCLESVVNQTYVNLEIIVVNDGSTDNSQDVINQYIAKDSRVILFNKENAGLVQARKSGIDIASGKYIQYLDSDDTLYKDAVSLLVDKAEKTEADIVVSPFLFCYDNNEQKSKFFDFTEMSGSEYLRKILLGKAYWCVWSKFHLRSLYQNKIERPDISLGEDAVLSTQLLMYSRKVVSIDFITVNYNFTPNSMSHPSNFNDKMYLDFVNYTTWVENYILRKGKEAFHESLSFFHLENTFRKIRWKQFSCINRNMKRIITDMERYSWFLETLSRRERKIVNAYRMSSSWGYLKLRYYSFRKKI